MDCCRGSCLLCHVRVGQSAHLKVAHITHLQELLEVPTPKSRHYWAGLRQFVHARGHAYTHTHTHTHTKNLSSTESDSSYIGMNIITRQVTFKWIAWLYLLTTAEASFVFSLYLICGVESGAGSSFYPTKKLGFPQVWQKLTVKQTTQYKMASIKNWLYFMCRCCNCPDTKMTYCLTDRFLGNLC
jgi:hypothetical protein